MTNSEIVDKILAGGSIRESVKEALKADGGLPVNEGFSVGAYLKFANNVDGYFAKDTNGDVHLVFAMPMDGLVGKLNPSTIFKLIGYKGDTAKIVAMTNDHKNGNNSGEIYFVARSELDSKAKAAQPRKNKSTDALYPV